MSKLSKVPTVTNVYSSIGSRESMPIQTEIEVEEELNRNTAVFITYLVLRLV
jgi:hypothetical protein